LNVVGKNPRLLLHSAKGQDPFITEVVKDGVVDNVDAGKVTPEDKTKVSVVSHVVAVL
jgi:acyl-CoA hydrolase